MTISKVCSNFKAGYSGTWRAREEYSQYFDGHRFSPKRVADDILSRHHFFTLTDTEQIYSCNAEEGIYQPGGEQVIRDEAQRLLGDRTTNHYVSEVGGYIRRSRCLKRSKENSVALLEETHVITRIACGVRVSI